ncbi:MAG: hypothetical protein IKB02_06180 [Clostridia bacterium]|nr:hypothetical protein [Clostridia bacterium]
MMDTGKETAILFARLDDLSGVAMQGQLASTPFLSPRELHFSEKYLASRGMSSHFISWGGYESAERRRMFILPDYIEAPIEYSTLLEYGFDDVFSAVEVRGSGYRSLSHRDFLGSVIGLGLERSVVGDIIVFDEEKPRAIIICDKAVCAFICETLSKVGSDNVKCSVVSVSDEKIPDKNFLHITDTVASLRLDGVVAALLSLSREKAKTIVLDGAVELDYETCERPDKEVPPSCLITVRGHGKFRINSICDRTKKGRLRLDADKYV